MALKAKLTKDDFDKLPEAHREFYKQSGTDYLLDAEGVEDVTGLKGALEKERKERAEREKELKAEREKFKDIDPVKYAQLVAEADNKENDDLKSKGKIDEIIEKNNTKFAAYKIEMEGKLAAKDQELDRVYIDARLRESFEKAGVIPDRIDDAVELTKPRAKRNEKGELTLVDKDGSALDVSVEVYAKEMLKEAKPWLYAASGAGGSGAPAGNGTNGAGKKTIPRATWEKMSSQESTAFFKEGGTLTD